MRSLRPGLTRLLPLFAVLLFLAGCKTELHRGLAENEANEIVAVLMRAGIPASRTAEKTGATLTVSVEESRFADAVYLLRQHGLPRLKHPAMTDIFKGDGLVASPTEERARYIYALQESLAGTISQIDGVLSARVHIVLPENDALRRSAMPSSASVFIRHAPGAPVGDVVPQVKQLVQNSVAGLDYDKVTVVVVAAAAAAPANGAEASAIVPVLGLWVHRDSAQSLAIALASGAALLLALAGIGGWLAYKGRFAGRRPAGTSVALR